MKLHPNLAQKFGLSNCVRMVLNEYSSVNIIYWMFFTKIFLIRKQRWPAEDCAPLALCVSYESTAFFGLASDGFDL